MALTISQQVDRFIEDTDLAHMIIHGDLHTTVRTEGGLVRSFARVIADADSYFYTNIDAKIGELTSLINSIPVLTGQMQELIDNSSEIIYAANEVPEIEDNIDDLNLDIIDLQQQIDTIFGIQPIVVFPGSNLILTPEHQGSIVRMTDPFRSTVVFPPGGLPVGFQVLVFAEGGEGFRVDPEGITLIGDDPYLTAAQNTSILIVQASENQYIILGGSSP